MYLYLDDHRTCPRGFTLARNMEECVQLLQTYEFEILSLDYDLGWGQPTGGDLVRWMVQQQIFPKAIYMHSSSTYGRSLMYQLLAQAKPEEVELYQVPVPERLLQEIAERA